MVLRLGRCCSRTEDFRNAKHLRLALGLFGAAPLVLLAVLRAKKQRAPFTAIRANYDRLNACGGIIMSEEAADMGAWLAQLPEAAVPGSAGTAGAR